MRAANPEPSLRLRSPVPVAVAEQGLVGGRIETDAAPGTPEAFGAYIKTERIKWAKVIKTQNIKAE